MNAIKFFKANGLYAAASFSSANSFFFKHKSETKILFRNFDKYLSSMIDIIDIKCFPAGWIAIFRTKSDKQILEAYTYFRAFSKVAKTTKTLTDVEHILSEHFRMMNSQTVRACNKIVNRHGSRVHSRFQKMIFENIDDYKRLKAKLDQIQIFSNQYLGNFLPEFGLSVHQSDVKLDQLIWDNFEDKKEVVENFKRFYEYYGKITKRLNGFGKKLKAKNRHCFVDIKTDVIHTLIRTTLRLQKHQFPPRFPIFNLN